MENPGRGREPAKEFVEPAASGDFAVAYALLRLTLGINIALHGISRIMAGQAAFTAGLMKQFASTPLPHFALQFFGYGLPWAEAVIGLLVLLGAFTREALIAGALLMALLTFGSSLIQDWNVAGLQLIYAVVYFLLIALLRYNRFSVDRLFGKTKSPAQAKDA